MICPKCGKRTYVIDSRRTPDNKVNRRRVCKACKHWFTTQEVNTGRATMPYLCKLKEREDDER